MPVEHLLQGDESRRILFERQKLVQFAHDEDPVEDGALSNDDAFDVEPGRRREEPRVDPR
jgi:hypothetical protein